MKTCAAVAWQAGQPLTIEELELDGPSARASGTDLRRAAYDTAGSK